MAVGKPTNRRSQRVTETSDAMDLEQGGKNLPAAEKKILVRAKDELRRLYGRPPQAET